MADMTELKLAERKRELLPVADVRECFGVLQAVWCGIARQLQKREFGDAFKIVEQGLSDALRELDGTIGRSPGEDDEQFDGQLDPAKDLKK